MCSLKCGHIHKQSVVTAPELETSRSEILTESDMPMGLVKINMVVL
jgi:hypothetical protein